MFIITQWNKNKLLILLLFLSLLLLSIILKSYDLNIVILHDKVSQHFIRKP